MTLSNLIAEAILSTRSDAIVATDRDGIIHFWNPGAERIFGYSREAAVGQSLDLIIPDRLRQRHWKAFSQFMRSGQSRYGESDLLSVPALHQDGRTISVQFTITPIRKLTDIVGVVAVMRDATAQYEETRQLKRALADLSRAAGRSP